MSDQFDFTKLLSSASDMTPVDTVTSDIQNIQKILTNQASEVAAEQSDVRRASVQELEATNKTVMQQADLSNIILDEQVKLSAQLGQELDTIRSINDPAAAARKIQQRYKEMQDAQNAHNKNIEDAQSLNPFVGIPATIAAYASEASLNSSTNNLKLELSAFDEVEKLRTAAISNYTTRSTLLTENRAKAEKELNSLKALQTVLSNKKVLEVQDLKFAKDRYDLTDAQVTTATKVLNAAVAGKQVQMATLQAQLEATLMPYRIEQTILATEKARTDMNQQKAIAARVAMIDPNVILPPDFTSPSAIASMDSKTLAVYQAAVSGANMGHTPTSYSDAVTMAKTGTDVQATRFVAMADAMRDQYNAKAKRDAQANQTYDPRTWRDPIDVKDPNYAAMMDTLIPDEIRKAESVDATAAVASGFVVLESSKNLRASKELPLEQWLKDGLITENGKAILDGDVNLSANGSGAGGQISVGMQEMENARNALKASKGIEVSDAELAQAFKAWADFSLHRSNASPNTAMNLNRITFDGVDSFTSKEGFLGGYKVETKPLDITDMNQLVARFESLRKRREAKSLSRTLPPSQYKGYDSAQYKVGDTDSSPYGWMKLR